MVTRFAVAQYPDPAHSQDRVFVTSAAAIVLDGASAFLPVDVPTSVYVDFLGREITGMLRATPDRDLGDVVAESITATAERLDLRPGNSPSSTVTILRNHGQLVDLYALGDSAIYYGTNRESTELTDSRLSALGFPEHEQFREQLASGCGFGDQHRALLSGLQRKQRARRNRPDGYWIAEANGAAGHEAVTITLPCGDIAWAVLATDGAYEPIRHLRLDDWRSVAHQDSASLLELLEQCAEWETQNDPSGIEFPRAKVSDDKTLVAVTFE